jgi:hypothetical protein
MPALGARQHTLALDFDHAGAAVADRFHPGLVAKTRNLDALTIGNLDQGFARQCVHFPPVQQEFHGG